MGTTVQHVAPDVLPKILDHLSSGFKKQDIVLIDSILMALARLMKLVKPTDSGKAFHGVLFWVALGSLHLGSSKLYASALAVLETVISAFEGAKMFGKESLFTMMAAARKEYQEALSDLDSSIGISFGPSNFNYSMAASLMRGLQHSPTTINLSIRLLTQLLSIETASSGPASERLSQANFIISKSMLAYVTALLPVVDSVRQMVVSASGSSDKCYSSLFQVKDIDAQDITLIITLMVARLKQSHELAQRRLLFDFLAQAIQLQPRLFVGVQQDLFPLVDQAIRQADDPAIVASCHTLVRSLLLMTVKKANRPLGQPTYRALLDMSLVDEDSKTAGVQSRYKLISDVLSSAATKISAQYDLKSLSRPPSNRGSTAGILRHVRANVVAERAASSGTLSVSTRARPTPPQPPPKPRRDSTVELRRPSLQLSDSDEQPGIMPEESDV
jgi:hypothetical protein